jgi:membrane protein DedA with SNARE-associated domain
MASSTFLQKPACRLAAVHSLTHSLQTFIAAHGLEAVFVLMVLESACVPIPSELTMIYAGYLVSQGSMNFIAAVLVGTLANLVGSWIAWAAGAYGVDAVLMRSAHNRHRVEQAHDWFERYGAPTVFFARLLPIVRTFISLPAGVARMPLRRFSVLTVLGTLPWCLGLVAVGDVAGRNWDTWQRRFGDLDYVVVAAAIVLAVALVLRRKRAVGN